MPTPAQADPLRGSIEMLILKTLSLTPQHGWGIGQRIRQISNDTLDVNQGSLYPALQRLEFRGLITSAWKNSENNRRARYYSITQAGVRALAAETANWHRFASAIETVLGAT